MDNLTEVTDQIVERKLSAVAKRMKASIIREMLKSTSIPGMISFGGGVPDPETFPREHLAEIAKECVEAEYKATLQYGTTEGDKQLKQQYINYLRKYEGIEGLGEDNMVITTGSQQALDLVGRTFLDTESTCAICDPVYLGAASAFMIHAPNFIKLTMQEDGPDVDFLESSLKKMTEAEKERFKFFYLVSNFDNPTGICLSLEKRLRILEIAATHKILIVEDDPYGLLRFEGEKIPSIFKLAVERGMQDYVLLLNTFSKILSPGLRIGIVIGNSKIVRKLVVGKQVADLCTSPLLQRMTARYLERHDPVLHLQNALKVYAKKRDTMMASFKEDFGNIEGVHWTYPQGGLFSWMCFPEWVDTMEMLEFATKNLLIYVPGIAFSVGESNKNCMRLSFCLPSEEQIREGSKRLLKAFQQYSATKGDDACPLILVINPGSTSTKVGVFKLTSVGPSEPVSKKTISHDADSLRKYPRLLDQIQMRTEDIERFVEESGFSLDQFDAYAARGGILPPMTGGTYEVNAEMVHYLKELSPVDHASNLAAVIAYGFAEKTGKKAYITDPVSTDEFEAPARYSGIPEIERKSFIHALNMKAVSRIVSKEIGKPYDQCRFVVAHLGGGISVGALKNGRFIDVNNANDEGPFSPERTGELPVGDVVKQAYSGDYTAKSLKNAYTKRGGLVAYLNTNDLRAAFEMAKRDSQAAEVIEAMVFQIAKEIGGMCAVLQGKIDAIILTGGMAHLIPFVEKIKEYVYNFGLVTVVPGEDELKALAEGTFAVLGGTETAGHFAITR